jgi:hypothetical protein
MGACGAADRTVTEATQKVLVAAMVIVELAALGLILLSLLILPHLEG